MQRARTHYCLPQTTSHHSQTIQRKNEIADTKIHLYLINNKKSVMKQKKKMHFISSSLSIWKKTRNYLMGQNPCIIIIIWKSVKYLAIGRCFTSVQNKAFAATCKLQSPLFIFFPLPRQNTQQTSPLVAYTTHISYLQSHFTIFTNQQSKKRAYPLQIHKAWPGPFHENVFLASQRGHRKVGTSSTIIFISQRRRKRRKCVCFRICRIRSQFFPTNMSFNTVPKEKVRTLLLRFHPFI